MFIAKQDIRIGSVGASFLLQVLKAIFLKSNELVFSFIIA